MKCIDTTEAHINYREASGRLGVSRKRGAQRRIRAYRSISIDYAPEVEELRRLRDLRRWTPPSWPDFPSNEEEYKKLRDYRLTLVRFLRREFGGEEAQDTADRVMAEVFGTRGVAYVKWLREVPF